MAALDWYRGRERDLDGKFLRALDSAIRVISEYPEAGLVVEGALRRQLVRGFPHVVFYLVRPKEVVVVACMHGARDPRRSRELGSR